jgi:hypothetical protein
VAAIRAVRTVLNAATVPTRERKLLILRVCHRCGLGTVDNLVLSKIWLYWLPPWRCPQSWTDHDVSIATPGTPSRSLQHVVGVQVSRIVNQREEELNEMHRHSVPGSVPPAVSPAAYPPGFLRLPFGGRARNVWLHLFGLGVVGSSGLFERSFRLRNRLAAALTFRFLSDLLPAAFANTSILLPCVRGRRLAGGVVVELVRRRCRR